MKTKRSFPKRATPEMVEDVSLLVDMLAISEMNPIKRGRDKEKETTIATWLARKVAKYSEMYAVPVPKKATRSTRSRSR